MLFFYEDEKVYLNAVTDMLRRDGDLSQERVLETIALTREFTDPEDKLVAGLIERTYVKVKGMGSGEWEELEAQLPFFTLVGEDDFEDDEEIPELVLETEGGGTV